MTFHAKLNEEHMVTVKEVLNEGLNALLGKQVTFLCMNYFYTGTLAAVNTAEVKLTGAAIVYDTGDWKTKKWANAQELPGDGTVFVRLDTVEAYGVMK